MNAAREFLMAQLNEKGTCLLAVGDVFGEVCREDAARDGVPASGPVRAVRSSRHKPGGISPLGFQTVE